MCTEMEILVFDGDNVYGWLIKAEQYFKVVRKPEAKRLSEVVKTMRGSDLKDYGTYITACQVCSIIMKGTRSLRWVID